MPGAPVDEIDATLLTFKIRSDRPLWSEQFRKSAAGGRPSAATHARELDDSNVAHCGHPTQGFERQQCSGCCRWPAALELTVLDTLQSRGHARDLATNGRFQGHC